jgi:lysozyme family protein
MPLSEAEEIYARKYAKKTRFNDLESGKDCVMFDYGVNSGPSRPIRAAQKMLGKTVNGVFNDNLVEAINEADTKWFISSMKEERLTFMHAIKGGSMWKTFGRGWLARVNDLTIYSLALAAAPPVPDKPLGPAKGSDLPDVPLMPDPSWLSVPDIVDNPKAKAEAKVELFDEVQIAGDAVLVGGIAGLAGAHDFGYYAIILTGVILLAGAGYILYQRYQAKKTNETVVLPAELPTQAPLSLVSNSTRRNF